MLVNELRLSERRDLLKDILENAVPVTFQDVVVIFCTVTGQRNGQLVQISDARKIYHQNDRRRELERDPDHDGGRHLRGARPARRRASCRSSGFVRQEQVDLDEFLANRFGRYYEHGGDAVRQGGARASSRRGRRDRERKEHG